MLMGSLSTTIYCRFVDDTVAEPWPVCTTGYLTAISGSGRTAYFVSQIQFHSLAVLVFLVERLSKIVLITINKIAESSEQVICAAVDKAILFQISESVGMTSVDSDTDGILSSLEIATNYARSGRDSEKLYQYICVHPADFFAILPKRRWSIAHQVVYHGDVNLFKRLLSLFFDQKLNIRSTSGDRKTLLDVAREKQTTHQEMFAYIEHLFTQDELMEAAKASNWSIVMSLLEKNRYLVNEKPPYSPYFLLHHVVMNGDVQILKQLLEKFHPVTDVRSANHETPLQIAIQMKRSEMCSLLRGENQSEAAVPSPSKTLASPLPTKTFELINSAARPARSQPPIPEAIRHVDTAKTTVVDPPVPDESNEQTMEELTCILTNHLFVDPVIASDGRTYERSAILDWIHVHRSSPITGAPMNATVKDDLDMKRRIQRLGLSSKPRKN